MLSRVNFFSKEVSPYTNLSVGKAILFFLFNSVIPELKPDLRTVWQFML